MIRGSTTSCSGQGAAFFVSFPLWLCWHTLLSQTRGNIRLTFLILSCAALTRPVRSVECRTSPSWCRATATFFLQGIHLLSKLLHIFSTQVVALLLFKAHHALSPPTRSAPCSYPLIGKQRASHCNRECWRVTAKMILSIDTFVERVSAFDVSFSLCRLLAHTLYAPRGNVRLTFLVLSM